MRPFSTATTCALAALVSVDSRGGWALAAFAAAAAGFGAALDPGVVGDVALPTPLAACVGETAAAPPVALETAVRAGAGTGPHARRLPVTGRRPSTSPVRVAITERG